MSSRPILKLCLTGAASASALLLAACSSNGGSGSDFSLAGNPGAIDQPGSSTSTEPPTTQPPGNDVIVDAGSGGGGGGGGTPRTRVVTNADGTVSRIIDGADTLLSTGNADLGGLLDPLRPVANQADGVINPLGQVVVAGQTLIGSGAAGAQQLVAVSALSNGQPSGQLVGLGLLNTPNTLASVSLGGSPALVIPAGGGGATGVRPGDLVALNVGGQTVLGSAVAATPAVVGVGLGSTTPVGGQLASANVAANGNIGVTVGAGAASAIPATGGLVIPIPGVVTVGVLSGGSVASVNSPLLTGLGLGR